MIYNVNTINKKILKKYPGPNIVSVSIYKNTNGIANAYALVYASIKASIEKSGNYVGFITDPLLNREMAGKKITPSIERGRIQ